MEILINNASVILAVICSICILISVITEFTKEIGFSLIICIVAFFAVISYKHIAFVWYYLVAVIFGSFIIALITAKGWEYFIDIVKRYWKKDLK